MVPVTDEPQRVDRFVPSLCYRICSTIRSPSLLALVTALICVLGAYTRNLERKSDFFEPMRASGFYSNDICPSDIRYKGTQYDINNYLTEQSSDDQFWIQVFYWEKDDVLCFTEDHLACLEDYEASKIDLDEFVDTRGMELFRFSFVYTFFAFLSLLITLLFEINLQLFVTRAAFITRDDKNIVVTFNYFCRFLICILLFVSADVFTTMVKARCTDDELVGGADRCAFLEECGLQINLLIEEIGIVGAYPNLAEALGAILLICTVVNLITPQLPQQNRVSPGDFSSLDFNGGETEPRRRRTARNADHSMQSSFFRLFLLNRVFEQGRRRGEESSREPMVEARAASRKQSMLGSWKPVTPGDGSLSKLPKDAECVICLGSLISKETETDDNTSQRRRSIQLSLVSIPCGHIFHLACILEWSTANDSCPICRANLQHELDRVPSYGTPR